MKYKMLIGLALTVLTHAASAEYSIKIPLEVRFGGHLPNGSINIAPPHVTPPNPYPGPSVPVVPVEPPKPVKPTLYTTVFPKPAEGVTRYNGQNGVFYDNSLGLSIFVETSALKNNTKYTMFYDEKNICVVETSFCTWGAGGFGGGCGRTDSKISNGPKVSIRKLSGNCLIGEDYVIKIREL